MSPHHNFNRVCRWLGLTALLTLCAACAEQPAKPEKAAAPVVQASAPVAKPAPMLPKATLQKMTTDARDLLQDGQEARARDLLQQVLAQEPANEMARKLLDQITADPQLHKGEF